VYAKRTNLEAVSSERRWPTHWNRGQ